MELLLWAVVFIASMALLVKSADWLLEGAERIGFAFGLTPFVVGVVIVGLGTSFPEIVSSFAAVLKGATEIVAANAVGSNIANILLIVGISALVGKRLTVTKNLIDLELPLLAASTLLFLGMVFDGIITIPESALLLVAFAIYFAYSILHSDDTDEHMRKDAFVGEREVVELPSRISRRMFFDPFGILENDIKGIAVKDILLIAIGIIGLALGAKYLIDSVIALSQVLNIATGVIALAAVALGTSLPELLVSVRAAWQKKSEVALGNIFGSNVFNILVVVGLPGLFTPLVVDASTLFLGVPVMIFATFVFIISGISRRIHAYEGAMYLVLYAFFIGKLFGMF